MRSRLSNLAFFMVCAACVPSHRLVAEGNRHFEQCYGTDFEPAAPDGDREACWQAWIAHYTRQQPASRVDYALQRIEALQARAELAPLPGLGGDAPEHAAPPPESPPVPASDAGLPRGCEHACDAYEARCEHACPPDTGECRLVCVHDRARCMAGCP